MPFRGLHVVFSFFLDLIHVLLRSDHVKDLELLLLRQELRLYERKAKQPRPSRWEKLALAAVAATLPDLSRVCLVFTPATLLRWHREIVKQRCTFNNAPKPGRPPTSAAFVELILRLAHENPRWGYGKLQGELGKLGHRVAITTIKRILRHHGLPPAPERGHSTWRTFLARYRGYMVACDFFTIDTLCLQRLSILFFIELGTRRIHLAGCTATPDAAWVTQQARQFTWHLHDGDPGAVRFLLDDHDGKFAAGFDTVFASGGMEVIKTPVQAPNAYAYAERVLRSLREECLDHLLVLHWADLTFVLKRYLDYYNHRRPHQGLGQQPAVPTTAPPTSPAAPERVRLRSVLGGLLHDYAVAA